MKREEIKSGVYRIYNWKTGMSLVGSSIRVKKRVSQHFSLLKKGNHNENIQSDYNEIGLEFFTWGVLEPCLEKDMEELELKWIKHYMEMSKCYNLSLNTARPPCKVSPKSTTTPCVVEYLDGRDDDIHKFGSISEAKRHIGITHVNMNSFPDHVSSKNYIIYKGKDVKEHIPIFLKDKEGEVVRRFKSKYHLSYQEQVSLKTISKKLNNYTTRLKGVCLVSDSEDKTPYIENRRPIYNQGKRKINSFLSTRRKIYSVDSDGNVEHFDSIKDASKLFGTKASKNRIGEAVNNKNIRSKNNRMYRGRLWYPLESSAAKESS